jgi:hypothetical protein
MVRGIEATTAPSALKLINENNAPVLSEINLLRYPFCILSNNNLQGLLEKSAQDRQSHIVYKTTDPNGTTRVWRVRPNTELGYTTPFDKAVLMAVLKLVTDDGFPPPQIYRLGSVRRICRALRLPDSGPNLKRIREALERISSTAIYAETFYLKTQNAYWQPQTERKGGSFTLWSVFWKNDRLPNGETADTIYLQFNAPFILSLHDYYVKPIDFDYWLSLPPLAQRICELTGLKFYGMKDSSYVAFEYGELCQALPIIRQQHVSLAQRILERAHKELKRDGWFARVDWAGAKVQRTFDPKSPWVIRYYPGPRAQAELALARERLRRFQERQIVHELPLWQEVDAWVQELTDLLGFGQRNKGYYIKIGKLILSGKLNQNLVWEAAHTAKTEDLEGRLEKERSAYFTDYLKRELKARTGKDLKDLLAQV